MQLTLDAAISQSFWPDMEAAQLNASFEAADTGSTVMRVRAIEARSDRVLFIGTVPTDSLQAESTGAGRMFIRPRGLGKLYTTQGALTHPTEPVGFLLLHHPVRLTSGLAPDEGEFISVALEVPRFSVPMATWLIGPVCCSHCNEPISVQRLRAVPSVRVCTKCQRLKEKSQ